MTRGMITEKRRIYLDNNATTSVDPVVLEAMMPYFSAHYGNAASRSHAFGWFADAAVTRAREEIAGLLDVDPDEMIFTSGATESANLAIKGIFEAYSVKGRHIIAARTEHRAVLDPIRRLEKYGAEVSWLDVDANGLVRPDDIRSAIRKDTILLCIMYANNETGVIQPVGEIGEICTANGIVFFCDATQAVGKVRVSPRREHIHLMAFSAHKMHGPKGIGGLYMRRKAPRIKLIPQIEGGGHESGVRSGTLNVPGIVGFGKACALAFEHLDLFRDRMSRMRDDFEAVVEQQVEGCFIHSRVAPRLSHVSNLRFQLTPAEQVMRKLNPEIAVSSGSACTSASLEPSHVLRAMGLSEDEAKSSLRISLGRFNTEEEVHYAAGKLIDAVRTARANSPVWNMYKRGLIE